MPKKLLTMLVWLFSVRIPHTITLFTLFGCLFSISRCTPPPNWKPSPYLINRPTLDVLAGSTIIRVKLHLGKALPISSKKIFKFSSKNGSKFYKGGHSAKPDKKGIYIAKNNRFLFRGKNYYGKIKIEKKSKSFLYINLVPIRHYIISVIGHEMSNSWPLEALKAQAVVARSYAAAKMLQSKTNDYDVGTTTNHQVYKGIPRKKNQLEEAVNTTQGELLVYKSKLAKVFFHSSCGGRLAASDEVWKEKISYLDVRNSNYCRGTPNYKWNLNISVHKFARLLGLASINQIRITTRSKSGRAKEVLIQSRGKDIHLRATKLRQLLGENKLKSYFFAIRLKAKNIQIAGRGYGHGVGMCQWGSRRMSEKNGMGYKKILNHFFPGTSVSKKLKIRIKV